MPVRPPSPRNPPPEVGVVTFLSPNKSDQGLIEIWNTNLGKYTPIDVGTPHPDSRQYPGYRLGNQRPLGNDTDWVIRTWVTDETSPDWFNWSLKFSGEDDSFPIFVRTYRERRDTYVPREKATPLSTLYKTEITFAGSGYATGALPTVEFHDPLVVPGTVAVAHAVVAPDGTISEVIIDNGGEGYLEPCSFRVADPVNGEAATGIAFVQPQSAILIKEEAALFPQDSEFYADYLQVTRVYETIPGPIDYATSIGDDGMLVTISKQRKLCSDITSGETLVDGVWCKTTSQPTDSDIICEEVVECRAVPGNLITSITLDIDGMNKTVAKRYQDATAFTPTEGISSGTWLKVEREDVSGSELVVWEIGTSRPIPGNLIDTTHIDENGDILNETRQMVEASTLTTTNTIVANVWTKTFEEPVSGSDIVAWKVVQVRTTQNELNSYSIEIPDLIPAEFRGVVPITTTGQTLIGDASMPTLGTGEISHEERQLDDYTYRETISGRPDLELPVTLVNQELTEEYGGGVLNVTMTLAEIGSLTIDEGLTVVDSSIRNLGNGLGLKTTKELVDAAWPVLSSRLWDEDMRQEYDETKQVVDDGTTEDPDPGGVFGWVSEVKAIDKWRSLIINTSKPTPVYDSEANALISFEYKPFRFPGLLYPAQAGYYVRHADADLVQHKLKTWWLKSATTPTVGATGGGFDVEIDEIIQDDVVISSLNNTRTLDYSKPVLHDDVTTFGALFYPATTPSYTEYALGTPTGTALQNAAVVYNGGTGYAIGNTLTIASGGFTMSVDVTFVDGTGVIGATTVYDLTGTYPPGFYGPIASSGGAGSGAFFDVASINVVTYTPGSQWIGTYRVIGAEIKPAKEKDIWKIVTESVVMR